MLSEFPIKGNRIIYYSCVCMCTYVCVCVCVCVCVYLAQSLCFSHSLLLDFVLLRFFCIFLQRTEYFRNYSFSQRIFIELL